MAEIPTFDPNYQDPNTGTNSTSSSISDADYGPLKTGSLKDILRGLTSNLGKDYTVRVADEITGEGAEGQARTYGRFAISHRGGAEMVLDMRTLMKPGGKQKLTGAVTGSPVIAIRQEGQVGEAAERTYGGKAFREEGAAKYRVYDAVQEIADLVRGGHKLYEEEPTQSTGSRTPTTALTAIMGSAETGRGGELMKKIRQEFHIASAGGLAWGQQRPTFYEELARRISIYWGPEKAYKEQQILESSLSGMRYSTQAPIYYDPVHKVLQTWPEGNVRRGAFGEEEVQLPRMGEEGLKTFKQLPSLFESREEVHPVVASFDNATGKVMRKRMSAPTPDDILGTGSPKEGAQYPFTGKAEYYGERLGQRGGVWMDIRGQNVLTMSTIVTQTVSGAGTSYVAKNAVPQTDSAGNRIGYAFSGSQVIPLPWERPQEFTEAVRQRAKEGGTPLDLEDVVGKSSKANRPQGLRLGFATVMKDGKPVQKPLYTESKPYEAQVDAMTLVVPKYFNMTTNEFSPIIPARAMGAERAAWVETNTMEADFRKVIGKGQAKIEYSGTNRMYLSVATSGFVDLGFKLRGVKESATPTGLEGWNVQLPGGGVARAASITQEVKSGGDLWVGAWEAQPFENKMRMLSIVDPELERAVRKDVQSGRISAQNLSPQYIANMYQDISKPLGAQRGTRPYETAREVIGKAINTILQEQDPTQRLANYRRFGIYSITDPKERMGTEILTQEAVNQFKATYHDKDGNLVDPSTDNIKFEPMAGGLFRVSTPIPTGSYILPKVVGVSAEWPMGGGKIPTQAVAKFNAAFPDTAAGPGLASILGLSGNKGVLGAGDPSNNVKAWVELIKSDKYRNQALTGTTYRTPNTLVIDQKVAREISAELQLTQSDLSGKGIGIEQVKKLADILQKKGGGMTDMIYFKGTGAYMPTTNVPQYLDEFNKATGSATTGMSARYLSAMLDLLSAETTGRAQGGSAYRRFVSYTGSLIDRSNKANKVLSTIRTGAAISRNYNILDELAPNEAVMSDAQLEALAWQQPGVETEEDAKKFIDHVNKQGYLPAFFHRIPSVGGVNAVKILTTQQYRKQYGDRFDPNADLTSAQGTVWVNRWMHESGIGDRDIDKALIWSGLITQKEAGTLKVKDLITATSQWQKAMRKTGAEYIKEFEDSLGSDSSALVRKYSHIGQYYADFHEAYREGYKPGKTADFGWVRAGVLNDVAQMWSEIRARRASSYNTIRQMEEAVAVMGVTSDVLTRALGAYGIQNVQSSLEANKAATMGDPLEKFFQSLKVTLDGGNRYSVGLPGESGKMHWTTIDNPEENMGGSVAPRREQLLNLFLSTYTRSKSFNDEMLGVYFGGVNDPQLATDIINTVKGSKGIDRYVRISSSKDLFDRIVKAQSPLGAIVDFSLNQTAKSSKDVPLDIKNDLLKDVSFEGGKFSDRINNALGLLKALRTGRNIREFDIKSIMDASSDPTITEGAEGRRLAGYAQDMGLNDAVEITTEKEWGGLQKSTMETRARQGMRSMRASDFSHIAAGIESLNVKTARNHKLLYQKMLGASAEWIGQMYELGDKVKTTDIWDYDQSEREGLEEGTAAEQIMARRMKENLGVHVGKGRAITAQIAGTEIRFIPDFLKLDKGRLIITEAKRGGKENAAAGEWQAAVNKYGIIEAYNQNPNKLRATLEDYKKQYDEARGTPEGEGTPELANDWVEGVMQAIGKGNVDAHMLQIGHTFSATHLFNVLIGKGSVDKMIKDVVSEIKAQMPENIMDLKKLSEGAILRANDFYNKSGLKTVSEFRLPKGIVESVTRLFAFEGHFKPAGPLGKWLGGAVQKARQVFDMMSTGGWHSEVYNSDVDTLIGARVETMGERISPEGTAPPTAGGTQRTAAQAQAEPWDDQALEADIASAAPEPAPTPAPVTMTGRGPTRGPTPQELETSLETVEGRISYLQSQAEVGTQPSVAVHRLVTKYADNPKIVNSEGLGLSQEQFDELSTHLPKTATSQEVSITADLVKPGDIQTEGDANTADFKRRLAENNVIAANRTGNESASQTAGGITGNDDGTKKPPPGRSNRGEGYGWRTPEWVEQKRALISKWFSAQTAYEKQGPGINASLESLLQDPRLEAALSDEEKTNIKGIMDSQTSEARAAAAYASVISGKTTGAETARQLLKENPAFGQIKEVLSTVGVKELEGNQRNVMKAKENLLSMPNQLGATQLARIYPQEGPGAAQVSQNLTAYKNLLEQMGGGKAGGGFSGAGSKDIMPMTEEQVKNVSATADKLAKSFGDVETRMASTNEVVKKSTELWRDTATAMQSPAIANTIKNLEDTLKETGQAGRLAPGYTTTDLGKASLAAATELAKSGEPASQEAATRLMTNASRLLKQGTTAEGGEEARIRSEGADLGHVARRALGGFGVMYLRSMFGLATGGLTTGEKEAQSLQGSFAEAAAKATGGARPFMTQEQKVAIQAGLWGSTTSPFANLQQLMSTGVGREVSGAVQMGIGTFAASQWLGDIMGGEKTKAGRILTGWGGMALTGTALVAGGVADVLNQQQNLPQLAYKNAMQLTGGPPSISSWIGQATLPEKQAAEYTKQLQSALGAQQWAGIGYDQAEYDRLQAGPQTHTAQSKILAYQVQQRFRGKGAYDVLTEGGFQGSKLDVSAKGIPLIAAAITQATPEYANIAGELAAFAVGNNFSNQQIMQIAPQWQYGMANPQNVTGLMGAFGTNLAMMKGGIGTQVLQAARQPVSSAQRDIMMQGAQYAQGLGGFAQNMAERAGVTGVLGMEYMARQLAPLAGTAGGTAFQAAGNVYMQTLGTGAPIAAPFQQAYYNMSTTQAQLAQNASQANLGAFNTYQNISMYGGQAAPPAYLTPETATNAQIQNANLAQTLLQNTQGVTLADISTNLSLQGFGTDQITGINKAIPTTGVAGKSEAQYIALRTKYIQARQQLGLPYSPAETMFAPTTLAGGGSMGDMARLAAQGQAGVQNQMQLQAAVSANPALGPGVQQFSQMMMNASPAQFQLLNGISAGSPLAFTTLGALGQGQMVQNAFASQNLVDIAGKPISLQQAALGSSVGTNFAGPNGIGSPNGTQWGQTSWATWLNGGAQQAVNMLGGSWTGATYNAPADVSQGGVQAAVNGFTLPGGQVVGGNMAMSLYGNQLSYQASMASAGASLNQLALTSAFTTGVGLNAYSGIINPQTNQPFGFNTGPTSWNVPGVASFQSQGGGFWGMQDAQMQLGWAQQQNQFKAQRTQMGIQSSQFYTNMAQQQQQVQAQRGWTQQDWGYNAMVRGQQWQWQQQDFQENVRFMTGRDRRLAERQMGRATTLHDEESGQISKQQDRQKELWAMEDTRFVTQKQQFEESQDFQKQQLTIAEGFFEASKKMQQESNAMQRAYWVEQQKLQKEAIEAQAGYAAAQYQLQQTMAAVQLAAILAQGAFDNMNQDVKDNVIATLEQDIPAAWRAMIEAMLGMIPNSSQQGSSNNPSSPMPEPKNDHGSWVWKNNKWEWIEQTAAGYNQWSFGQTFVAGEGAMPEKVTVQPLGQGTYMADAYHSRWNDTVSTPHSYGVQSQPQMAHIVFQIGDEVLVDKITQIVDQEVKV